ncbi:MAG: GTPase HflX [Deltaproteobacteria bacterium]
MRDGGDAGRFQTAHLLPPNPDGEMWRTEDFPDLGRVEVDFEQLIRAIEGEMEKRYFEYGGRSEKEGVFLVGFTTRFRAETEESLAELQSLVESADKIALDKIVQARKQADPRYLIGKGKLEEVILKAKQVGAETLIFDTELTPAQVRGITDETNLRVVDRTQLILQIFAKRAATSEGKIQVELAQLRYMLPRLTGKGAELSQLGGGIGTRGPGEKKLEEQRRTLRKRIETLEKQIGQISRRREHTRKRRVEAQIPVVTLIGYTNVGKSTLFNALTRGKVIAENKLFSTLSPTTRKILLPRGRAVLITDTVGFIRELPKELVNAFRATLEELGKSTVLVHIANAGDENVGERIDSVEKILDDAGYGQTPRFLVFNKSDEAAAGAGARLQRIYNAPLISALDRKTLDEFLARLEEEIERQAPARSDDALAGEQNPEGGGGFEMDYSGG